MRKELIASTHLKGRSAAADRLDHIMIQQTMIQITTGFDFTHHEPSASCAISVQEFVVIGRSL